MMSMVMMMTMMMTMFITPASRRIQTGLLSIPPTSSSLILMRVLFLLLMFLMPMFQRVRPDRARYAAYQRPEQTTADFVGEETAARAPE